MAIDTRDRRSAAVQPGCPWRNMLPAPNAGLSAEDRAQTAGQYSGLVGAPVAVQSGADYLRRMRALLGYQLLNVLQPGVLEDDLYRLRR